MDYICVALVGTDYVQQPPEQKPCRMQLLHRLFTQVEQDAAHPF